MFATKCSRFDNLLSRTFYPSYDSIKCCELLLDYGANLETRTLLGTTALMMAQAANNVGAVKLLIKRGADVNPYRINGQNVFDLGTAKTRGRLRKVMCRSYFDTVLHQAAYMEDISSMRNLISAHECPRQFVNIPGKLGWTPLHTAVFLNRLVCVRILLRLGANPEAKCDVNSVSPLHLAASRGHLDILNELMKWIKIKATSRPNTMHSLYYDESESKGDYRNMDENTFLDANSEMVLYSTSP